MKKSFTIIITLIAIVLGSTNSFGQGKTEILLDSLESYIEKKLIPGAMIGIVTADSTIFVGGIGYADIQKKEKVTEKHLFRQGSISKSFTAMGLYKLLGDSPYDLSTPIIEIDKNIPFTNKWKDKSPVRVSHLLEHTSGFEDFHLHAMYNTKYNTLPDIINLVNDHRNSLHSRWMPGTKKAYANPNYILAGHLIEKISNNSFTEYVDRNILKPIGMRSSGYFFNKPEDKLFAQGYQRNGKILNPIEFATINGSPAGDFCANAVDMAAYLQHMIKRDTSVFSKEEFERIESPKTSIAAKNGLIVGYGLGNYSIWKNGFLFHGHGGQIDGFTSRYVYSRDAGIGVAVAINRNGNANEIVDEILEQVLSTVNKMNENRKIVPIPDSMKDEFSGFYEFKSPKSKLTTFPDDMLAGLKLDFQKEKVITRTLLGKSKDTLYYAGKNQFYLNDDGVPSVLLIAKNSENKVLWINDNYTVRQSWLKRIFLFFGILLSVVLVLAFTLSSLIWLIRNGFRKNKKSPVNQLTIFGVGVSFILIFVGFGTTASNLKSFSGIDFPSVLTYLSSFTFVIMSVFSIYRCFKLTGSKVFNGLYILTSIGALSLAWYLWSIGFIGLKMWNY
ncbi:serine hydrolase domain-containing protein [Croceitalea marina]|uniref:Serine hydrolase domain-containing protein n=1 Tax=Croceitalea marina TaxID=1775166 RepID=A0ABW5MWG0_9FLAO